MRTESWFLACVLIPCSMAAADDIGPFGFEGRWGNVGTNCVSDAEQVPTQITSTTIGFDEDHCTLTSVEPLGDPATSWIVETECESEGSSRDVTFLLGVVEVDGERKLTLTNMRTGSSGMFEDCDDATEIAGISTSVIRLLTPLPAGTALTVTQTPGGPRSHKHDLYYGWDFALTEDPNPEDDGEFGLPVLAVADGLVIYVEETVPDGAPRSMEGPPRDPSLGPPGELGNVVTIEHEIDGQPPFYSSYLHLQQNSVGVELGQRVLAGEVIAAVGHTGVRDGSHLHLNIGLSSGAYTNDLGEFPHYQIAGGSDDGGALLARIRFVDAPADTEGQLREGARLVSSTVVRGATTGERSGPTLWVHGVERFVPLRQTDFRNLGLYVSEEWATSMIGSIPRYAKTCLSTVYAMIEHARGNSDYRIGQPGTWSDEHGATGFVGETGRDIEPSIDLITAELTSGNPVILQGHSTALNTNHFMLAIGVTAGGNVVALDPLTGTQVEINRESLRAELINDDGVTLRFAMQTLRTLDFSSSAAADHTDMPTMANVTVEDNVGEPDSTDIFGPETVLSEDLNWIDGWLPVYWVYPEECTTSAECLRLSGASESVVFFAETYAELYDVDKRDGIWLTYFVEAGSIDVGKIPVLQTEEYAFVLLNGASSIFSVNREFLNSEDKDRLLQMDQDFAVLHSRFPELSVWGTYNDWIGARPAPGGGQRFIFRFSLNNGCRLCENAGWIYVAYDFDRSGNYLGLESLGLSEMNGPPPPEVMIWLQESLNELGYYSGPIDGSLGRQTRAAIEAFMRDHGIVRPAGSWSWEGDPSGQPFGELDLAIAAALGDLTSAPTLSDQHPN